MCCYKENGAENLVAFVFSCPGRHEQNENRPAAKITGNNLDLLFDLLNMQLREVVFFHRSTITINNAWPHVEYNDLTGRSEATDEEIRIDDNIERLNNELNHIDRLIVCCGNKAKLAIGMCSFTKNPKIVNIEHLGIRGLNDIEFDVSGTKIITAREAKENGDTRAFKTIQQENTARRLSVVCSRIIRQLEGI